MDRHREGGMCVMARYFIALIISFPLLLHPAVALRRRELLADDEASVGSLLPLGSLVGS